MAVAVIVVVVQVWIGVGKRSRGEEGGGTAAGLAAKLIDLN